MRQLVSMFTAKFSVNAPLWKRYSGQRSIVPPAKSARQGAYAVIVPALSETRDESMPEFVSRRCDFVRVSSGCAASLKNKVGPLVNGVATQGGSESGKTPFPLAFPRTKPRSFVDNTRGLSDTPIKDS